MTAQTPEPITPAPVTDVPAPDAPLTFQAPTPAAPGRPNPIRRGIPWGKPITPNSISTPAPADQATA
ncbi:hypothetical protein QFZ60_000484 [Arthrobacter sp. B2I5]|uniref:hypothetical protein n=1 Tax=Arthrobacter sp. B2I5 TaxID=3042266 RepID=UPI002782DEFE|nr:hypothetical protein [Arthrobacter sp. B2I5]MDQ0824311.1 hypothetical protein [Arthrobacter sp. B2I5]